MRKAGLAGTCWPTPLEEGLLEAVIATDDRAAEAWKAIRPSIAIDDLRDESHRLLPLVARNLAALGIDDRDLARIKGVHHKSWYRNQLLLDDAAAVTRILHDGGVASMVLRGVVLATRYYPSPGLRYMNDVDILVAPEAATTALELLVVGGLQALDAALPALLRQGHAVIEGAHGRSIVLHWRMSRHLVPEWAGGHPNAGVWERGVPIEVRGARTLAPSSSHHLLQVCLDGPRGPGVNLRWVVDAHAILTAEPCEVDWELVVSVARTWRATAVIGDALAYLVTLTSAPVPAQVLEELAADRPGREVLGRRLSAREGQRLGVLPQTLDLYLRASAHQPVLAAVTGLPRFLRTVWGLEHPLHLPVRITAKGLTALSPLRPARRGRGGVGARGDGGSRRDAGARQSTRPRTPR